MKTYLESLHDAANRPTMALPDWSKRQCKQCRVRKPVKGMKRGICVTCQSVGVAR